MESTSRRAWLAPAFIWLAAVYLLVGVLLGVAMAKAGNYQLSPTHAHVNLLGWVSLALFGCIYRLWPQLANHWLATLHFWLYNIGLLPMMIFLTLYRLGNAGVEPMLGITSLLVTAGVLAFVINTWTRLRITSPASTSHST